MMQLYLRRSQEGALPPASPPPGYLGPKECKDGV